jgi:cyclase
LGGRIRRPLLHECKTCGRLLDVPKETQASSPPTNRLAALMAADVDEPLGKYLRHAFGAFDFEGIEVPPITQTFAGAIDLDVGGRRICRYELGPAHTSGDVIGWLPDERVVFTGDILFVGSTPIMWAGPIGNWITACEMIESLNPTVIVPGHGPLTDLAGVQDVVDYLRFVQTETITRHPAGMTPEDAARDLDLAVNGIHFANWTDRERLVVTVHAIWRELEAGYTTPDIVTLLNAMANDFTRRTAAT